MSTSPYPQPKDPHSLGAHGYKEGWGPFGDPDAQDPDPEVRTRFFGKYRGTVMNAVDPLGKGRLLVQVVDVFGPLISNWAMPCVPFAGLAMGAYARPIKGTGVWVEFEQGDPQMPIWTGFFWGPPLTMGTAGKAAQAVPETPVVTLETVTSGISISDIPLGPLGNLSIRCGPVSIMMTPATVSITAPAVSIRTPLFSVNGTALTVTGP